MSSCKLVLLALAPIALGVLGIGCDRAGSPSSGDGRVADRAFESMAAEDAVIRVNGHDLTKRDVEDLFRLRNFIYCLRKNQDPFAPLPSGELQRALPFLTQELIHHELFRQYAVEKKIEPTAEQVEAERRKILGVLNRDPQTSLSDLARGLPAGAAALFCQIPYQQARDHLLRQSVTTNDLDRVSEAEVKARENFVREFDANADRLNGVSRKKLLEIRKRILAGQCTFEEAARESEVSPGHGKVWETCELGELPQDEDLYKWLLTAGVGDVSEPLDLPDGLAIVKLVSKQKGEAPKGAPLPDTYTLVKCTMHAFERMRYQDRAQMTEQLLIWKREDAQKKLGTMLMERAKIEFPNGKRFFPKESKEGK